MTPEQQAAQARIEEKLDALIDDTREVRRTQSLQASTLDLVLRQVEGISLREAERDRRIAVLEAERHAAPSAEPYRHMSPSFTNEVAESVGHSMAPATRALRSSAFAQAGFGCVIALALLAFFILGGGHR